ncbi:uncharacterized protein LOC122309373 [Carya illinoinensis]|uniref:uncharacterized protein LOC122309373 n=1 Tax=Carya illinoinensis TaxID=32201 RepID=UPI001C724447|nr:uncharacterized protein LOC122309373 [Carya illinoinensis]
MWGFTKDGRFSVRSAYHLGNALGKSMVGECSNKEVQKQIWEGVWRLNVPNPTKQFVWKALKGILPTRQSLVQRKIIEDATCPICQRGEETISHVLWSCLAASDVRAESGSGLQKWPSEENDFYVLWSEMQTRLQQSKLEEVSMILRGLWTRRNMMFLEGKFDSPRKVLNASMTSLQSFHNARAALNNLKGSHGQIRKNIKWKPPDEGVSKVNFDAAIDKNNFKLGLGIVARNHVGEVLFTFSSAKQFSGNSDLAEAAALWRAMELVLELDVRLVVFEGDAARVIRGVTEVGGNYAWMEQQYANIRGRLLMRPDWSMSFIHR